MRRKLQYKIEMFVMAAILAGTLVACAGNGYGELRSPSRSDARGWKTDLGRSLVPLTDFKSGGVPKDAIPSIDSPVHVDVSAADSWLKPSAPILVVSAKGRTQGYPLEILLWHEIVNDTIGGLPIAVTYCPLCSAPLVFKRTLGTKILTFGTTGMLRRSDLVMYDRQTESWWQQFTGRCLLGELAGSTLEIIDSRIMSYQVMKEQYPDARVLSRDTGFPRNYGFTPYIGYEKGTSAPSFFDSEPDNRLPPLQRIAGVAIGSASRAYELRLFDKRPLLNDRLDQVPLVIIKTGSTSGDMDQARIEDSGLSPTVAAFKRTAGKRVLEFYEESQKIRDRQTGSIWTVRGECLSGPLAGARLSPVRLLRTFSFSWFAFFPDSDLYRE